MTKLLRISLFFLSLVSCLILVPSAARALEELSAISSYAMSEYWYRPTYYSSVEEALGALKNAQGKIVGWQGSFITQWDADAYGLRALGTVVEVTQNSLFSSNTVQVPQVESTVIPFAEVKSLHLVQISVDRQFTFGVRTDLANDMRMFRVADYQTAAMVYNALATLVFASGNGLSFPVLGATFRDITPKDLWIPGLKEARGMIVTSVMRGSPAEKGDLRVRDAIVMCNGQPVESIAQWSEKIPPRQGAYDFNVLRKSTPPAVCHVFVPVEEQFPKPPKGLAFAAPKGQPAPAAVSSQPGPQPAAGGGTPAPPKMGFSLRYPSEAEKKAMGGKTGAVVAEVAPGGLAEAARLKAGDILLECNGKPIPAPEGLGSLLVPGENLLVILRNGQQLTVKVGTTLVSY